MEMIYLVISYLGKAGMATYFRGKVCPWEVQKTIHLSFLACLKYPTPAISGLFYGVASGSVLGRASNTNSEKKYL